VPATPADTTSPSPDTHRLPAHELHRYCVWIVSPPGYIYSHAFDEIALGLSEAMATLGGSAPVVRDPAAFDGRIPIILGGNLLTPAMLERLPRESIVYNLEQVGRDTIWFSSDYVECLKTLRVVDYSPRNRTALAGHGVYHAGLLEIGYSPGLARIPMAAEKDIDVLFYGCLNERRVEILRRLGDRGLRAGHITQGFGDARDEGIGRAKVVLNMHFYESAVFEIVRVSYLLANGVCVLTEGRLDDPDIAPYAGGIAVAAYDELVDACELLVRDADLRDRLAARGREAFRARPQAAFLSRAIDGLPLADVHAGLAPLSP